MNRQPFRIEGDSLIVFRRRVDSYGFVSWLVCIFGILVLMASAYDRYPEASGLQYLGLSVLLLLLILPLVPSPFLSRHLSVPWARYDLQFNRKHRTVSAYNTVLAKFEDLNEALVSERETHFLDVSGALRSTRTDIRLAFTLKSGKRLIVHDWGVEPDLASCISTADAIGVFVGTLRTVEHIVERRTWDDGD